MLRSWCAADFSGSSGTLEEVDVRLGRRTFLLLVDTLVPFTDNHVYVLSI